MARVKKRRKPKVQAQRKRQDKRKLTLLTLNPEDDEEWNRFIKQLIRESGKRIRHEVKRLVAAGIIDEKGNLVVSRIPPEMRSKLARPTAE